MNIGFEEKEINQLKLECEKEGQPYIIVEDENNFAEIGQAVHFQFIGAYEGREVIYDALMTTLEMEYELELYDTAVEEISGEIKRNKITDESKIEEMLDEAMDLLEEEGAVKVSERLLIDPDFDFGIGIEYVKHIPIVDDVQIRKFIDEFNNGSVKLDKTLYSFESAEDN